MDVYRGRKAETSICDYVFPRKPPIVLDWPGRAYPEDDQDCSINANECLRILDIDV